MEDVFKELEDHIDRQRKSDIFKKKESHETKLSKHDPPSDEPDNRFTERAIFILVIAALLIYIVYDASFVHPTLSNPDIETLNENVDIQNTQAKSTPDEPDTTQTESSSEEIPESTTTTSTTTTSTTETTITTTTTTLPELDLSGEVTITFEDFDIIKKSDTMGYINSVTFSIENGLKDEIAPSAVLFAYDSETKYDLENVPRGTWNENHVRTIDPGDSITGSIELTPRTFAHLDIKKDIVIEVNVSNEVFSKKASVDIE